MNDKISAEGIYDPGLLNDRLLLGLKGTMSEFELGILRQRAQEAYRQKVLRGEVLTIVPVDFCPQPFKPHRNDA
jgi:DNA invertase Pin-like site-specific DNA recombinase